jgi:hypothetical protein
MLDVSDLPVKLLCLIDADLSGTGFLTPAFCAATADVCKVNALSGTTLPTAATAEAIVST